MKAAYEPTDEECEWKADEEEELTVSKQVQVTYTPACFLPDWLNTLVSVFVSFFSFNVFCMQLIVASRTENA